MLLAESVVLLLAAVAAAVFYRRDILHPAFWTNAGFVGYAIGGLYYCAFGYGGASFLNLAKITDDRDTSFAIAMSIVIAGFVMCNLGFVLGQRATRIELDPRRRPPVTIAPLPDAVLTISKIAAVCLTILGLVYWVYFADRIAGGIVPLFAKVAAFKYMAADAHMSSLPFHFVYAGVELWMLAWVCDAKRKWIGLLLLPIGVIVASSTGRIAFANTYGFVVILTFIVATRGYAGWKSFATCFSILLPLDAIFYFLRQYSSYVYIGKASQFPLAEGATHGSAHASKLKYIADNLIGGGNVPDLQQLILIVKGLADEKLHLAFGSTYFDWLQNLLASRIGSGEGTPQSVGYRILAVYFPTKVGGPTPGMIGEAIINFGWLTPIALIVFTTAMVMLYAAVVRSQSLFARFLYCEFLIGTWALFLKVDSSLLLDFLWAAAPISLCWVCLQGLARIDARHKFLPAHWALFADRAPRI